MSRCWQLTTTKVVRRDICSEEMNDIAKFEESKQNATLLKIMQDQFHRMESATSNTFEAICKYIFHYEIESYIFIRSGKIHFNKPKTYWLIWLQKEMSLCTNEKVELLISIKLLFDSKLLWVIYLILEVTFHFLSIHFSRKIY